MRYLLIILLTTCNNYTAVVIKKGYSYRSLEAQISEYHYVLPLLTIDEYDSIKIGDTLIIDKLTLKLIK